jgi:hypothetical protein
VPACREHYNPLTPIFKLLAGFLCMILTILWILHIILYMLFTVSDGGQNSV